MQTKEELYSLVNDLLTKSEYDKRIDSMYKECDGLISKDAIALLIVDELGRYEHRVSKIKDLRDGVSATLTVNVVDIDRKREFQRKDGSKGSVVNLIVSDGSGYCRLVLWDDDTKLVDEGKIKFDSKLRIVNAYVRETKFGLEVNLGKFGNIEVIG